jgi:hypothetical protein
MDYKQLGDELWERFNRGREGILWYYESLATAFEEVFPGPLSDELSEVVQQLRKSTTGEGEPENEPVTAAFHCEICNKPAATITVIPEGCSVKTGDPIISYTPGDQDGVLISGFGGEGWQAAPSHYSFLQAHTAIFKLPPSAKALFEVNPDWAPFFCVKCGKSYCWEHWKRLLEYDDGFFDCVTGTCPEGHRKILDA